MSSTNATIKLIMALYSTNAKEKRKFVFMFPVGRVAECLRLGGCGIHIHEPCIEVDQFGDDVKDQQNQADHCLHLPKLPQGR